ncbi:MAG: phosphatidylserine decarboxylase family protein [Deltaproteobacteria bacterium]|nr:phosphatidylserine decarboxylase family protein [Deltaproteobacteria bacterium]
MRLLPIAREGIPFVLISLAPVVVIGAAGAWMPWLWWFEIFFGLLFLFVLNFFRDPEREIPVDETSIVSPADGRVIKAGIERDDRFLGADVLKICIFMNVFNVHVNRSPATGAVTKVVYNPGKFFNASFDKASLENEQNAVFLRTPQGRVIVFNQIAGLIARRIVCHVRQGSELAKGARFGMIRFGSRVDVYLPKDSALAVKVGDKVSAGSSILARWAHKNPSGADSVKSGAPAPPSRPARDGKKTRRGARH